MKKSFKKIAAALTACTMAFALAATVMPSIAEAGGVDCSKAGKKAGKAEIDLDGTYHAYFNFQQPGTWIYRDAWFNPSTGLDGKDLATADIPYTSMLKSVQNKPTISSGTITDAEIKGNGTYTVGVTGLDSTIDSNQAIAMIGINTDIPSKAIDDGVITISDVKISTDGVERWNKDLGEPYFNLDAKEWGLTELDIVNTYQAAGYASPTIVAPTDSIEITFTVSGFNSDNPDAVEQPADDGTNTSDDAASGESDSNASSEESSGGSPVVPIVIVVVVIVVIGAAVVVMKKKTN